MVKPKQVEGKYVWDVLDGQQRLTTMLLVLTCINEKLYTNSPLKLYTLKYENRKQLDFTKITYSPTSPNYNYPLPTDNLDSYFVRKAKDRIERWCMNKNCPVIRLYKIKSKNFCSILMHHAVRQHRLHCEAKFILV